MRRVGAWAKNLVVLAPDVAQAFPSDEAVNKALRLVLQIAEAPHLHAAEAAQRGAMRLASASHIERKDPMTALNVLLADIGKLEAELNQYERKFGVKSDDFYAAMMRGDLEEFDALDEYRMEFIDWLALYKTWLSLNDKYRQLIARQPVPLQIKINLEPAHA